MSTGAVESTLSLVTRLDPTTEHAVRRFRELLSGRFATAGVIVYGSRARGTHRPDSDADVAVLLRGKRGKVLDISLEMADLAFEVLLETGVNISPLPVWLDQWEHPEQHRNPRLLRNIAEEGISL
ncbi:MAG: nucleotidyltransferase domain-containing protein [Steroidobacteraceae bacterium]